MKEYKKKMRPVRCIIISALVTWIICAVYGADNNSIRSEKAVNVIETDFSAAGKRQSDSLTGLMTVGFTARADEPSDEEVKRMIDEVIMQVLGPEGLKSIIKNGDKVVIKVNNVVPYVGRTGEKGRGVITDARIVRYVAEKVREIIGFEGTAVLKVVDAVYSADKNPSVIANKQSFYWAHFDKNKDNNIDPGDINYDGNADGILDGTSKAQLVNLDAVDLAHRYLTQVRDPEGDLINVWMPDFIRTKQEALMFGPAEDTNEYCDVLIGLPILKSHALAGVTGAIKLHYGFRPLPPSTDETGRFTHSGLYWDFTGMHKQEKLFQFLCAQHKVRDYDFILMDCLTGNRRGPTNPKGGISSIDYEQPVDFILTHALMASRNSAAVDTAEALLAGYDPSSIGLLKTARFFGLGPDSAEFIQIAGLTNFSSHRRRLSDIYSGKNLYPFENNWGGARIMFDLRPPENISLSAPVKLSNSVYSFGFTADDSRAGDLGLARVDLYVNGSPAACLNSGFNVKKIAVDLMPYKTKKIRYRIAVWDRALNCALSDEKEAVLK